MNLGISLVVKFMEAMLNKAVALLQAIPSILVVEPYMIMFMVVILIKAMQLATLLP